MSIQDKFVTVDGRKIHYLEDGVQHGRPVVLLHGGFGDAQTNWSEIITTLNQEFHVLAPDLPGYGQSEPVPGMRIDALLAWLDGFILQTDVGQAALVGNSFGGLIARIFAATSPDKTPALVLVDGGIIPKIPRFARAIAAAPLLGDFLFKRFAGNSTSKKSLKEIFHNTDLLTDEFAENARSNGPGLAQLMRGMTLSAFPENQRKPIVPVLLVWGEQDSISPIAAAHNIKKGIPGATLAEIADCGHLPHIEAPEVFSAQVSLFLKNLDRQQRDLPGAGPLLGGI